MSRIYKYPLQLTKIQEIEMPRGAQVIHVGVQANTICLWAIVDTACPVERRSFAILATGHLNFNPEIMRHLGSVIMNEGALVWHVFEPKEAS